MYNKGKINDKNKPMTYISFTKHCIERCCERHPEVQTQKVRKYAVKEAELFLETTLRDWLWKAWQEDTNLKRKIDREWKVTLTNWEHKIVYTKVWIWELLIITYWYKDEVSKLEWEIAKMLPNAYNKNAKNRSKYKKH